MSKGFRIGLAVVAGLFVLPLVVWLATSPEPGVKLSNELDDYAIEYLETYSLLEPGEAVLAYYDATISMNGSEAAVLTNRRVMYHKGGRTTSIDLGDILNIDHRYESLIGDIIEIQGATGTFMKIEIAPWNEGETFLKALQWERMSKDQ